MVELIYILCISVGFISGGLSVFMAYRQGIRDGQAIKSEKPIEPIKVSKPKTAKMSEVEAEILEGYNNLMAYDGKPQGVKK